jgi:membrane protein implicated in regulation of membrane protease activity
MGIYIARLKVEMLLGLCFLYILMAYLITITWLWPFMDSYWNFPQFCGVVFVAFILFVMTWTYRSIEKRKLYILMKKEGLIAEKQKVVAPAKKKTAVDKLREELEDEIREELKEEAEAEKGGKK